MHIIPTEYCEEHDEINISYIIKESVFAFVMIDELICIWH